MSARQWKPGDVAMLGSHVMVRVSGDHCYVSGGAHQGGDHWHGGTVEYRGTLADTKARPLVVIDPEDREQVERLTKVIHSGAHEDHVDGLVAALRSLVAEPEPEEPTDPAARVTDRRENIWRLLADGDWVCTSGPDIGEYLAWDRLSRERGPLEVSDR